MWTLSAVKTSYRGFEIEVKREKCLGGWTMAYLTVFREWDLLELICESTEDSSPIREMVKWMKNRVDEAIETNGESECIEPDSWYCRTRGGVKCQNTSR